MILNRTLLHAALPVLALATPALAAEPAYDLKAQSEKLAVIEMKPDTAFLTGEEREVVNLLIKASDLLTEVYLRQRSVANPQTRRAIAMNRRADRDLLVEMFDRNLGPWDMLADLHPFWGTKPMPEGAGFYPEDLTRQEYEAYLKAHPDQKAALTSLYTVVRRDGAKLKAVPYSDEYKEWLEPAAKLLEQAAARTSNASLKTFLTLRAKAFRTDDYFASELAWMDLAGTPIEVAIGPYEVYTDRLMGAKASFESPIAVAEQVHGGGDNTAGPQTVAFNLPNDERVREAKGAKKVILSNVLGAKYERILQPMGVLVLKPDQAGLVVKKYMQLETLFHELSHSLGPGTIVLDGRKTTVDAELKEQASGLEEAKADVAGVWNILFMMQKGELPAAEKPQLFATYFAGIFRAVRFGAVEAHGRGAAMQYGYLKAKGAFTYDAKVRRYVIDPVKMETGVRDLLHDMLMLQATGDYAGVKAFMAKWAKLDPQATAAIATMTAIPVDIRPIYPKAI